MEHDERGRELEREAARLEQHSDEVADDIGEARRDWENKLADSEVPGAQEDDTAAVGKGEVPPGEEDEGGTEDEDGTDGGRGSPAE